MDLITAMHHAKSNNAANIIGIQVSGRRIEVYRPRYLHHEGVCQIEHQEGELFRSETARDFYDAQLLPEDARHLNYFVAPCSDLELDAVFNCSGEEIVHQLLKGAPDPVCCESPRDKAAFTSWCITTLAEQNS